ncbi:type II secretion system minor pseudopilin GspJ [Azotobacter salinestris]|uniref:type II secretion system minor pseudopilin GspJ n=1 Tax=Azotobacter salinestris TaxID=69964 RepID=UPI0032E04794
MKGSGGFTLLEMLVAMALLALLGLAAALTLNSGLRSQQVMGESIESLQRLQLTQQLLRRDLEQLVVRQGRNERGDVRTQVLVAPAGGDSQGLLLDFYKTGRRILSRSSPGSGLERVRYRLRDGRLIRESSPLIDTPVGTKWYSATLLEAVADVDLRFFHNHTWVDQWPPLHGAAGQGSTAMLPQALELTIETDRYGAVAQIVLLPSAP